MPSKLNTEFNYRYLVEGETPWEKIKILKGFLEGRVRATALEECGHLKLAALRAELENAEKINALPHVILRLKAELIEAESHAVVSDEAYELNRQEIKILEKLLAELYVLAEPTRIPGYTDEQMFEANAANEFTVKVAKEIQAEIIAHGHPSPAKLHNAMSNPYTFAALQKIGLIPAEARLLEGNADPLQIELNPIEVAPEILSIGFKGVLQEPYHVD